MTAALYADTLEHMFDSQTAFRHFRCHGVIHHRERLGKPIFQCQKCWIWSPDLLDLIIDPRLKTAVSRKETQTAVLEPTAD